MGMKLLEHKGRLQKLLGLNDWNIALQIVEGIENEPEASGKAVVQSASQKALIHLVPPDKIKDIIFFYGTDQMLLTLIHEMLHVKFWLLESMLFKDDKPDWTGLEVYENLIDQISKIIFHLYTDYKVPVELSEDAEKGGVWM